MTDSVMKWTAENQVKAGIAGGIEIVVKAINTHIKSTGVCHAGCSALMNMTDNNGKNTKKQQQMKWGKQMRTK